MKSIDRGLIVLGLFAAASSSQALVLNFDDVVTSSFVSLPANYQGFTWSANAAVVDNAWYNTTYGNNIAFPSAAKALFNDTGQATVAAANNALFTFDGLSAAFWAASNSSWAYASSTLTVRGYLNNVLVGSSSMNLGAQFASMSGFAGALDRLEFINDGIAEHYWLVDNVRLGTPGTVPEPMTMGLGLAAVAAYARRRLKGAA
jgi:hypothetical protein